MRSFEADAVAAYTAGAVYAAVSVAAAALSLLPIDC